MADPTKFTPGYSYSDWQAENPRLPLPAPEVDDDFANIATSVNETIDALKEIRRSDGALNNQIVTLDSLAPEVRDQIGEGATDARDAAIEAAQQSAQSASASAASAGAAAGSAGTAATSAGQAMTFRNAAQTAQTGAQTAQTGAQAARDAARQWSSAPIGQIVDDGVNPAGYSAYHWAEVAEGAAGGNLPDGAVTTAKLADNAVTTPKIANNAITNDKVATPATPADAISATKLAFTQAGTGAIARSIQSRMRDRVSVKDFGAVGNGTTDDTAAFKAARDFLQTNSEYRGGEIFIPPGRYRLTDELAFSAYMSVHNIYLKGSGILTTTLDFSGAGAGKRGIYYNDGVHFGMSDFSVVGAPSHGVQLGGPTESCSQYYVARLRIQNCGGYGLQSHGAFMATWDDIWSTANATGGFSLPGFHTSMAVKRCWAANNPGAGWEINNITYSTFISCGSDKNTWGYVLSNLSGVSFIGCGTEVNTNDGWLLRASNVFAAGALIPDINGVSFIGCFNLNNSSDGPFGNFMTITAADNRNVSITVQQCVSINAAGRFAIVASASAGRITVVDDGNNFDTPWSSIGAVMRKNRSLANRRTVLYRSVAQSIPDSAHTAVAWSSPAPGTTDELGTWATGTPSRLIVPAGASKVRLSANAEFAAQTTGQRIISLRRNGAHGYGLPYDGKERNGAQSTTTSLSSTIINVSPGDYFELMMWQNSGAALNTGTTTAMWFAMEVVE